MKKIIFEGKTYGDLHVIKRGNDHISSGGNKTPRWICECNNGHTLEIKTSLVKKGKCYYCSGKMVLPGYNDFESINPVAASEWDFDKNKDLLPSSFLPFSNKKVWWKCSKCNESWQASIGSKNAGHGCPYCTNHKPSVTNNLAVIAPDLAAEWNHEKNGDLKPEDIAPNYNFKVWWKCKRGHEWQAKPNNRMNGRGCRICSAELKSSFPEQAVYFYLSKLTDATNRCNVEGWEVDIYIPKLQLAIEYDGIAWHTTPKLVDRERRKDQALAKQGLNIIRIKEDKEKNETIGNIIYFKVDPKYSNLNDAIQRLISLIKSKYKLNKKVLIDIYEDRQEILSTYIKMEKENSFASTHPDIVHLWNIEKNKGLTPDLFSFRSNRIVWWNCPVCGGEWRESIINVSKGNRCPYCSGHKVLVGFNDLKTTNPELLSSWDYEKNRDISPEDFSAGSNRKVWWKCEYGHSWKSYIHNRTKGVGCPYCAGKEYLLVPTQKQIERWNYYYVSAQQYYESFGNLEVPAKYVTPDGIKLGMWIRKQRTAYKNEDISADRIEKLESIGMIWKLR